MILSQQDWGEMFISKNHYAVELARMGNKVYYVPGPEKRNGIATGEIRIKNLQEHSNLFYVDHCLFFPAILKFKARGIYDRLLKIHVQRLLQQTGKVDIVFSFDLSNTMPLKCFPASCLKIYMPVDELEEGIAVKAAETTNIIFSITYEILEKFRSVPAPKVFLNHGVSDKFISNTTDVPAHDPVQVGLSGNLLRADIDRTTLLEIINAHPSVIFNFWGSIGRTVSNITASLEGDAKAFVAALESCRNVRLHGALPPDKLAAAIQNMDCFLICYDIEKDQSKGTNYHKVLEYLATGKVVVSTNITTYNHYPGIIEMTTDRNNNRELPELVNKVLNDLETYNSKEKQQERVAFAKQFTYANQLKKIEAELNRLSA